MGKKRRQNGNGDRNRNGNGGGNRNGNKKKGGKKFSKETDEAREKRRTKIKLKRAARFLYDLQALRISTTNRSATEKVELDKDDLNFLKIRGDELQKIEASMDSELLRLLRKTPIWDAWLKKQPGVGPRLGSLLCGEFKIEKADKTSSMWRYAGLGVTIDEDGVGHADRMKKGDTSENRVKYNQWLKSKMSKVLGDSLMKASPFFKKPRDPVTKRATTDKSKWTPLPPTKWRKFYDNYRNRKLNQVVPVCMRCDGAGECMEEDENDKPEPGKKKRRILVTCRHCEGTGGPVPWGRSAKHRHQAALRYMCKMFLAEFWEKWREIEGLPCRPSYAEEYLGRFHHGPETVQEKLSETEEEDVMASEAEAYFEMTD